MEQRKAFWGNITLCCVVAASPHYRNVESLYLFFPSLSVLHWNCVTVHQKSNVPSESRQVFSLSNNLAPNEESLYSAHGCFIQNVAPKQMFLLNVLVKDLFYLNLHICPFYQELCLPATTTTTHQECIFPCRCFWISSGLCSKPAWCLRSSQSSASAWPTR